MLFPYSFISLFSPPSLPLGSYFPFCILQDPPVILQWSSMCMYVSSANGHCVVLCVCIWAQARGGEWCVSGVAHNESEWHAMGPNRPSSANSWPNSPRPPRSPLPSETAIGTETETVTVTDLVRHSWPRGIGTGTGTETETDAGRWPLLLLNVPAAKIPSSTLPNTHVCPWLIHILYYSLSPSLFPLSPKHSQSSSIFPTSGAPQARPRSSAGPDGRGDPLVSEKVNLTDGILKVQGSGAQVVQTKGFSWGTPRGVFVENLFDIC